MERASFRPDHRDVSGIVETAGSDLQKSIESAEQHYSLVEEEVILWREIVQELLDLGVDVHRTCRCWNLDDDERGSAASRG